MPATPRETTVSSILEELRSKKHDHEFLVTHQGLSSGTGKFYAPDELTITKTYRFKERSNPSFSSVLYLIETNDGLKGYSLDAFGGFSKNNEGFNGFIEKIKNEDEHKEDVVSL